MLLQGWLSIALLATGGDAIAQPPPQSSSDTVVVTGRRESAGGQMRRLVRQIASTTDGQLSRFADPVCPLAIGLSPASNRAIAARIRNVAAAAKVKLARDKCLPNLILAVAGDADAFVGALKGQTPWLFADLGSGDLKRALDDGLVHVWSTIEVRNEDGQPVSGATDDGVKVLNVSGASRINLPTQQSVIRSIVVLDAPATAGKSLAQVADYVAMRTLAGARPPTAGTADTILTLFDPAAAPPPAMTAFDRSYLKALYRTQPDGRATAEVSLIARTILKDTGKE